MRALSLALLFGGLVLGAYPLSCGGDEFQGVGGGAQGGANPDASSDVDAQSGAAGAAKGGAGGAAAGGAGGALNGGTAGTGIGGSAGTPKGGSGGTATGGGGGTAQGGTAGTSAGGTAGVGNGGTAGVGNGGTAGVGNGGTAGVGNGGTAGVGNGGTAGAGGVKENCWDGKDNDGDNLYDCDDKDCTGGGFQCVPSSGAMGKYVWIVDASTSCPAGENSLQLYEQSHLQYQPLTCGVDFEVTCTAQASCGDGTGCGSLHNPVAVDQSCVNSATGWSSGPLSCKSTASPQSCKATAVPVITPIAQWAATKKACHVTKGGSCGSTSDLCAPIPSSSAVACYLPGAGEDCPTGLSLTTYFDGTTTDHRVCTLSHPGCTLSSTSPPLCSGTVEVFCNTGCTGSASAALDVSGNCQAINGACSPVRFRLAGTLSGTCNGGCTATGISQPSGDVIPDGTIRVCCP